MLTIEDLTEILSRRHYKPGWTFTVYDGQTRREPIIRIFNPEMEDSYHPGETVPLDIYWPVPDYARENELQFDKALVWRVMELERHEVYEWYRQDRVNGRGVRAVFNPHRDGSDRDVYPVVPRDQFTPPAVTR